MEELIKRLERVIATGAPDKNGQHPISAEVVLEVVKGLSEHGTNLAEVGTDAITKQQAIDALRKLREEDIEDYGCEIPEGFNQDHLDRATFAIKQLPPIQPAEPQIIRCKDCKYWIPYDWMFSEVWQSKNIADYPEDEIGCNWSDMAMKANDFCSRAERREVTEWTKL